MNTRIIPMPKFWQLLDKRINTGFSFWNIQHLKTTSVARDCSLISMLSLSTKQGPAMAARHFIQIFGNGTSWQICQIIHKICNCTEFMESKLDLPSVLKEKLPKKENKHNNVIIQSVHIKIILHMFV